MDYLYTPPQIAKLLSISRQAVHDRIQRRQIAPKVTIGGTHLYDADALDLIRQPLRKSRRSLSTDEPVAQPS